MRRRVKIAVGSRSRETLVASVESGEGPVRLRFSGPSGHLTAEQAALADVVALARSPLPELTPSEEAALEMHGRAGQSLPSDL